MKVTTVEHSILKASKVTIPRIGARRGRAVRAHDPCAGAALPRHVMSRYCNALRNDPACAPRLAVPPAAPARPLPEQLELLPPFNTYSMYCFNK